MYECNNQERKRAHNSPVSAPSSKKAKAPPALNPGPNLLDDKRRAPKQPPKSPSPKTVVVTAHDVPLDDPKPAARPHPHAHAQSVDIIPTQGRPEVLPAARPRPHAQSVEIFPTQGRPEVLPITFTLPTPSGVALKIVATPHELSDPRYVAALREMGMEFPNQLSDPRYVEAMAALREIGMEFTYSPQQQQSVSTPVDSAPFRAPMAPSGAPSRNDTSGLDEVPALDASDALDEAVSMGAEDVFNAEAPVEDATEEGETLGQAQSVAGDFICCSMQHPGSCEKCIVCGKPGSQTMFVKKLAMDQSDGPLEEEDAKPAARTRSSPIVEAPVEHVATEQVSTRRRARINQRPASYSEEVSSEDDNEGDDEEPAEQVPTRRRARRNQRPASYSDEAPSEDDNEGDDEEPAEQVPTRRRARQNQQPASYSEEAPSEDDGGVNPLDGVLIPERLPVIHFHTKEVLEWASRATIKNVMKREKISSSGSSTKEQDIEKILRHQEGRTGPFVPLPRARKRTKWEWM